MCGQSFFNVASITIRFAIHLQRPAYHIHLPRQAGVVDPGPASNNVGRVQSGEVANQAGRGRRVRDPHVACEHHIEARVDLLS